MGEVKDPLIIYQHRVFGEVNRGEGGGLTDIYGGGVYQDPLISTFHIVLPSDFLLSTNLYPIIATFCIIIHPPPIY